MKTQRTPDGITWEGLPSLFRELVPSQSGVRCGDSAETQTFCAPAAFWRKLALSLRGRAVRALWQPVLGKTITNVDEVNQNRDTLDAAELESFIAEAAPGFGDLLRESVREPLFLSDHTDGEIACGLLVLLNGATAVVRVDSHQVTLQDCFFSRPARECPVDLSDSVSRLGVVVRAMKMRYADLDTLRSPTHHRFAREANRSATSFRNAAASDFDLPACLPDLEAAIAHLDTLECSRQPAATDSALSLAAYRLAAAMGYCRLFGIRPAGVAAERSLPARLLPLICRELTARLTRWAAADLSHSGTSSSLWADDDHLAGLFESRMEAWAVFIELDRAAGLAFIGVGATDPIDADTFDELLAATEAFDLTLQSREFELLAAVPRLIANCRMLLAPHFRECAPWWLSESLTPLAK